MTAAGADAVAVDDRPARLSGTLAVVAAAAAALLSAAAAPAAFAVGILGVGLVAVGVAIGATRAVWYGAAATFGGALLAGVVGGGVGPVVGATLGALLAWDLGEHAVNVGEQVGRSVPTRRGELAHAAASVAVGGGAALGVVAVYRVATGGLSSTALVVLSLAAVLLTTALRH